MPTKLSMEFSEKINKILNDELSLFENLTALLKQEKISIENNDPDLLLDITNKKNDLFIDIQLNHTLRIQLLASVGYKNNAKDLISCLTNLPLPAQKQALLLWENINNGLDSCQYQNTVNGYLISASYQHSQRALNILFKPNNALPLYDKHGEKVTLANNHVYTKI